MPERSRLRKRRLRPKRHQGWAVRVSGNWRLTFAFEGEDAILIDYQDYH
ncbi:MAG: type II toxin-antitoxin system RelE/ParE family toxin [Terriglobales bacterium]